MNIEEKFNFLSNLVNESYIENLESSFILNEGFSIRSLIYAFKDSSWFKGKLGGFVEWTAFSILSYPIVDKLIDMVKSRPGLMQQMITVVKNPKTWVSLGLSIPSASWFLYNYYFSKAATNCKGLSGADKQKCIMKQRIAAEIVVIDSLQRAKGTAKGEGQKQKIEKQIQKHISRLTYLRQIA
jgi:hypothetical protein